MHSLRRKLHHARSIVVKNLDTLGTISAHECALSKAAKLPSLVHNSFHGELENMMGELRNHLQTILKLLEFSNDIWRMVYSPIISSSTVLSH